MPQPSLHVWCKLKMYTNGTPPSLCRVTSFMDGPQDTIKRLMAVSGFHLYQLKVKFVIGHSQRIHCECQDLNN